MSVQYLTDANFQLVGGKSLRNNLQRLSFVLFKTDSCQYCQQLVPIFRQLAQQEMRVTWAIADIGRYRNIIGMARNSTTPIRAVPMLVFYVNGVPNANYKGEKSANGILSFLQGMIAKFNTPQQFTSPSASSQSGYYTPTETNTRHVAIKTEQNHMPNNVVPHNEPWKKMP